MLSILIDNFYVMVTGLFFINFCILFIVIFRRNNRSSGVLSGWFFLINIPVFIILQTLESTVHWSDAFGAELVEFIYFIPIALTGIVILMRVSTLEEKGGRFAVSKQGSPSFLNSKLQMFYLGVLTAVMVIGGGIIASFGSYAYIDKIIFGCIKIALFVAIWVFMFAQQNRYGKHTHQAFFQYFFVGLSAIIIIIPAYIGQSASAMKKAAVLLDKGQPYCLTGSKQSLIKSAVDTVFAGRIFMITEPKIKPAGQKYSAYQMHWSNKLSRFIKTNKTIVEESFSDKPPKNTCTPKPHFAQKLPFFSFSF